MSATEKICVRRHCGKPRPPRHRYCSDACYQLEQKRRAKRARERRIYSRNRDTELAKTRNRAEARAAVAHITVCQAHDCTATTALEAHHSWDISMNSLPWVWKFCRHHHEQADRAREGHGALVPYEGV